MEIFFLSLVYTHSGNEAVTDLLLRNGANPNSLEKDGSTALHRAAIKGKAALIPILVTQFLVNNLGKSVEYIRAFCEHYGA